MQDNTSKRIKIFVIEVNAVYFDIILINQEEMVRKLIKQID